MNAMDHQMNDQSGGLSVNAAVFVPRNYAPPIGTAPIQNLPTYMTNCFPFVQPDFNGNRPGGYHGNWNRHQRPNRYGNRNSLGYNGNRFPAPNKFTEPPVFPFASPPPADPYFNSFMPPPNIMNSMTSLSVMPSGIDGKDETESAFDNTCNTNNSSFTSNRRRRNQRDRNNVTRSNENIAPEDSGKRADNSNRQRRRTNSGRKGGNRKEPSKTLVLYEKEVQTDFSDSISSRSLEESPSPLFNASMHKRNFRFTDFDSGYLSPLHKGNQVTIGNQTDSKLQWVRTSNSIQSDDPSIVHAATVPQQKFSYAFIAQKEPSPKPVINPDNPKSVEQETIQNRRQPFDNRNNTGQATNVKDKKFSKNKSHDFPGRKSTNHNESNNQHINKSANKNYSGGNKNQGEMQSKGNQGKRIGQKRFNDRDENLKEGLSRRGDTLKEDSNDYGFSRTKNLNLSERRNQQDAKGENNSLTLNNEDKQKNQSNENSNNEIEDENTAQGKKKRRRRRKRKKKHKEAEPDSHEEGEPVHRQEVELHFEDVEEFPDLSSAKVGEQFSSGVGMSYSAILQTTPVQRQPTMERHNKTSSSEESPRKDNSNEGTRASRRRRKRKDILNKAAENELAEIGLEQQMLKEQCLKTTTQKSSKDDKGQTPGILKINPKAQPSGKKSKQNVSLDLGAVIDALEQKKTTVNLTSVPRKEQKPEQTKKKDTQNSRGGHNVLDANAPIKRGKERETPKPKKPSPLKKVILKEREEKKHLRMLEGPESAAVDAAVGIGVVSAESDLSQDAMSTKSSVDYTGTPGSANLSPVSQTSPISMSPLSPGTSPLSSEVNSPIAGAVGKDVIRKIHSRRFREYCNQVLDKDIDECATTLLQDLVRFQDRMYHKDPTKAKLKRRLVLGLREVTKHLKLKKIKCVIISPNLEKIQSKGGLDDALNNILNLCNEQNVPFVFALGRRALGRACAKLVPVSVVGIFNYSGSEENFHKLIDLTQKARESYGEMVDAIEKEIKEYPTKIQQPSIPHVFAHMGHSRTPSGASVLSFTSSILSEPISENYPHSEPETDSKGYEIIKDEALLKQGLPTDPLGYQTQMRIIHANTKCSVDDGNEADNEEEGEKVSKFRASEEDLSLAGSDMVSALPHIDSIHSSTYDLNTEILSQHSGRTLENCEAMSTHSSRTLGDGSSTILADMGDRSKHGTPKSTESPSNTLQRGKVIDEERIQHWVDETSSRLESLALEEESYEDSTDEMTDSDNESDGSYDKENFGMIQNDQEKDNKKSSNSNSTEIDMKHEGNMEEVKHDERSIIEINYTNPHTDVIENYTCEQNTESCKTRDSNINTNKICSNETNDLESHGVSASCDKTVSDVSPHDTMENKNPGDSTSSQKIDLTGISETNDKVDSDKNTGNDISSTAPENIEIHVD